MKNPAIILAIGVFFVLLWLYATNRISGILCSILCAILCALAVAREATVKILALVFLAGAAVGVAAMSEISGTAFSHAGAKAAGAVETATQRLISVSNAHNRKLRLEIFLNILKYAGWLGGLSGVWSAIHHWLRHF